MTVERFHQALSAELDALRERGTLKGAESVITRVLPAAGERGPRYLLAGEGEQPFLKMNSNNYLGMALRPELRRAEEAATHAFGVGPGAVRFISGTYQAHVDLEARLAAFHGRESAMIFSSAYAAVLGVLVPLTTAETVVISDELNHNCIINAMRLSRPKDKQVYKHLDLADLDAKLAAAAGTCRRVILVTDGIFSMRGDHAPLPEILEIARRHDGDFPEDVVVMVDDSHGVGAFGRTGRGTEESTGSGPADVLVATLGKALGVNGGYVTGSKVLTDYLRETSPTYIYSNPITVGECAAALAAVDILDSPQGASLLDHLRAMTSRFEQGLLRLGYETIPGEHPVTPLMVRDTAKTTALVAHLRQGGILATGLKYPVVPRGDESIRFQISADHTPHDVDSVLAALESFPGR
ncbi:MAG TPA: aminotransferase class I/II-fold pyridoxal phosphate-dependent enzyme [Thermoanaerobaculia bacterium]|jgi:glycine C-acetyltransferase|nr:aminotransferase class I/II-fold pyridoxal phosphate-dependent enzyme [Thermoanaerobaculia bacterium]